MQKNSLSFSVATEERNFGGAEKEDMEDMERVDDPVRNDDVIMSVDLSEEEKDDVRFSSSSPLSFPRWINFLSFKVFRKFSYHTRKKKERNDEILASNMPQIR